MGPHAGAKVSSVYPSCSPHQGPLPTWTWCLAVPDPPRWTSVSLASSGGVGTGARLCPPGCRGRPLGHRHALETDAGSDLIRKSVAEVLIHISPFFAQDNYSTVPESKQARVYTTSAAVAQGAVPQASAGPPSPPPLLATLHPPAIYLEQVLASFPRDSQKVGPSPLSLDDNFWRENCTKRLGPWSAPKEKTIYYFPRPVFFLLSQLFISFFRLKVPLST